MKQNIYLLIAIFVACLFVGDTIAQEVKISAELRPRYEMRHGYKTLIPDDVKAANFISQRTRLNAYFATDNYSFYLSLQDVRVWGDVPQLNMDDVYGPSIHEAWGQFKLCDVVSLKLGRQEIIYDDHRIFGNVGWAQQARSHDAAIFKINPAENHKVDVGLAYNANGESLYKQDYTVNSYKTFQYAWYHGNFNKFGLSFLVLNNGLAYMDNSDSLKIEQKVAFSQTIGPRLSFKNDLLNANGAFYFQGGKNGMDNSLSAMYFAADADFKLGEKFNLGAGFEYLSGTATQDQGSGDDKSFTPFYGTNHKFNGWMDYFYVGSPSGNVGLLDIYIPFKFKVKKFSATLVSHHFSSAAKVSQKQSDGSWKELNSVLGTEWDLMLGYNISEAVQLQAGYSHMFPTETMQQIKGGDYKNSNNWAWVMITFKPTFFEKK
jgi:hypothetical protein